MEWFKTFEEFCLNNFASNSMRHGEFHIYLF